MGARHDVSDSLGNSALHLAVLYHPSTQDSVDLLLLRGADVGARNCEGLRPVDLADDRDLKLVLRQLARRGKHKKGATLYTEELRSRVKLAGEPENRHPQQIGNMANKRSSSSFRGLRSCLRGTRRKENRKRKRSESDEDGDESWQRRRKRIRWMSKDDFGLIEKPGDQGDEQGDVEMTSFKTKQDALAEKVPSMIELDDSEEDVVNQENKNLNETTFVKFFKFLKMIS